MPFGFPVVAHKLKDPTSILEDVGSIPGLSQMVKNPVLPQAVVSVTEAAQIWCCCGYGVGQQLQLRFHP